MDFKDVNEKTQQVVSLTLDLLNGRKDSFETCRMEAEYFIDLQLMFESIDKDGYTPAVKDFASYRYDEKIFDMFFDIMEDEPADTKKVCYSHMNMMLLEMAGDSFVKALMNGEISPEELQ